MLYKNLNKGVYLMATFLLVALFAITMCIESIAYAFYEIKVNKNKSSGIVLIVLSLIGLVFPIVVYLGD